jgi:hypothetical protein
MNSTPHAVKSVTNAYRTLAALIRRLPKHQQPAAFSELRQSFRKNANADKSDIPNLLQEAEKKASFLRIMTPKKRSSESGGTTSYLYRKNGDVEEGGKGTKLKTGQVHSNWDGKNLDPCSVKRHYAGLRRGGFVNNLHAKGIF